MGSVSFASVHRDRTHTESGVLCQSYKEQALTENYDAGPAASIAKAGATRFVQRHPEHGRLFDTTVTYWAARLPVVVSMLAALVSASVVASIPAVAASAPSVKAVITSSGPSPAGQRVIVVGTNLVSPTVVNFGTTAASITSSTATAVTVTPPPGSLADVQVTTVAGTPTTSSTDQYSYLATSPPESADTVALIVTAGSLSSARASSPVAPICELSSTRRATQLARSPASVAFHAATGQKILFSGYDGTVAAAGLCRKPALESEHPVPLLNLSVPTWAGNATSARPGCRTVVEKAVHDA